MSQRRRFIPPGGALVAIGHRCLQARFLLTPSHRLNELALGVLAKAVQRTGAQFVGVVLLGNHFHLLLWVEDAHQMARCMEFLSGNLAREVGRLRRWKGKFWEGQYTAVVVAEDEASQVAVLRYLLEQGCKENLVASPRHWPGLHAANLLLQTEPLRGIWVDRTAMYLTQLKDPGREVREADFEQEIELPVSPLPCWSHLSEQDYRQRIGEMVDEIEAETAERHRRDATRPLGRNKVLRQNPRQHPPKSKKGPAPLIHASSKAIRDRFRNAYREVMTAYSIASAKLRAGDLSVLFPEGTFPPAQAFVPFVAEPRAG